VLIAHAIDEVAEAHLRGQPGFLNGRCFAFRRALAARLEPVLAGVESRPGRGAKLVAGPCGGRCPALSGGKDADFGIYTALEHG